MGWFSRKQSKDKKEPKGIEIPDGLWTKCPNCGEIIYQKSLEANNLVCPKCDYHFRISFHDRLDILLDKDSFSEINPHIQSLDPLKFKDSKSYVDRIKKAVKKTGINSAAITGRGIINGIPVAVGVLDFSFMGGSMGSVVGEKMTRLTEYAIENKLPLIIISGSGGARMQESIFSLMQMAKISAALGRLKDIGLPFLSILTDPTTGGVTASFSMLGDINIAEPKALIGFAGPRVIEQTIKQKLPEGFQRSEFLLEHGMVDMVIRREKLKETVTKILKILLDL